MSIGNYIPFHAASIGEEEIAEVVATLRSGWITTGARTARFEKEFGRYVEAPHALAVNSCTAGLHLALAGLGIGPGDEVITTPLTFCATVNTILHVGATPVLADIDESGNLDPESVRSRLTPRTRALLPVHYGGLPCQMDELWKIAADHGLFVIEDAAHAAGTHHRGKPIGSTSSDGQYRSDAVAFSFYATKSLTTGEGGMVTTHDAALYERMRILCLHGISKDAWNRYSEKGSWFYQVVDGGFKYNLSDIQSAIGLWQLRKQEEFIARRTEIARAFESLLADVEEIELPPDSSEHRHAWHLYAIRLKLEDSALDRSGFIDELKTAHIGASVHFIPIPLHPYYSQYSWADPAKLPRTMELYPRLVSLPIYPGLEDSGLQRIAGTVRKIVTGSRKTVATA